MHMYFYEYVKKYTGISYVSLLFFHKYDSSTNIFHNFIQITHISFLFDNDAIQMCWLVGVREDCKRFVLIAMLNSLSIFDPKHLF